MTTGNWIELIAVLVSVLAYAVLIAYFAGSLRTRMTELEKRFTRIEDLFDYVLRPPNTPARNRRR